MYIQVGTEVKSYKTIPSETQQTKTRTMDVTFIMKTKGSKRVPTTTNRLEIWWDKVNLAAAIHRGATGFKMIFTLSHWICRTITIESKIVLNAGNDSATKLHLQQPTENILDQTADSVAGDSSKTFQQRSPRWILRTAGQWQWQHTNNTEVCRCNSSSTAQRYNSWWRLI